MKLKPSVFTFGIILAMGMSGMAAAQGQILPLGYSRESSDEPIIEEIAPAPEEAEAPAPTPQGPSAVDQLRTAYDGVKTNIVIAYEDGQKIAWEGELACALKQTGWKPWSSGERDVSDAVAFCERMQSSSEAEAEATTNPVRVGMDHGNITVVEDLGSGEGWFLERRMNCGVDGLPISTLISGEAQNGNRTVTIKTGRAYSQGAAISAERACIEAARAAM